MKISLRRLICFLLLGLLAVSLITICNTISNTRVTNTHIASDRSPVDNCRVIQHEFGETCVPINPQRIVTLSPEHNLDPLIALGVKPIGFTSYDIPNKGKQSLFGASLDTVAGAKNVGNVYQPSLEKILMLKPDLILSCCAPPHYKLLSAIAPTIVVPITYDNAPANKAFNKETLRYIAKLLGQEAKAEEVLSRYQQRVDELKKRLVNQLQQLEIAVIFYGEGILYTISDRATLVPVVFNDIGLRYKFLSRSGDLEPPLSIEAMSEYDADLLFIVNVAEKPSSFYFQHPIFSKLKAVKNNRAYIVEQETWSAAGMLGANKLLDDLFKYLLQSE